jgi:dolichol-phosphate mannosyltransferase
MLFRAQLQGVRVAEVPITFVERLKGQSKLSMAVLVESVVTPWRLAATRGRLR